MRTIHQAGVMVDVLFGASSIDADPRLDPAQRRRRIDALKKNNEWHRVKIVAAIIDENDDHGLTVEYDVYSEADGDAEHHVTPK